MKQEKSTANTSPEFINLAELNSSEVSNQRILDQSLDVIKDVKVTLLVKVGEAELSVGELLNLRDRQVVPLTKEVDESVDILLEGEVVARGQLVAVGDNFGVQISEVPRRDSILPT